MSNMGFHEYTSLHGISLQCTGVGDRNVLEKMLENGYNLGGEQSGHIIFLDDSTTGDGQLAAIKFLSVISERKRKVSELVAEIPSYPQILENVAITGGNDIKNALMSDPMLQEAILNEKKKLGGKGRILVRPSGTEALIRVMVEAECMQDAIICAKCLTSLIELRSKLA
jgi:phosphoglucosamine mutase